MRKRLGGEVGVWNHLDALELLIPPESSAGSYFGRVNRNHVARLMMVAHDAPKLLSGGKVGREGHVGKVAGISAGAGCLLFVCCGEKVFVHGVLSRSLMKFRRRNGQKVVGWVWRSRGSPVAFSSLGGCQKFECAEGIAARKSVWN